MTDRTITLTDLPDGYEIEPDGRVFVIERSEDADGHVVRVHRRPIEPDVDVTGEKEEVRSVAQLARAPGRLALYAKRQDEQRVGSSG